KSRICGTWGRGLHFREGCLNLDGARNAGSEGTIVDRLFPCSFTDFGPCRLALTPPKLHPVQGARPAALRSRVREACPKKPGVYGMVAAHGELVYVGKAKNLRARLLSYFRPRSRDPKAGRILEHTGSIVWEVSPCEFAALHRELELIRR